MDEIEARKVRIFERSKLVAEHHRARRAITVEQGELRLRFNGKRRFDDRQNRCNAAAGGKSDVLPLRGGIEILWNGQQIRLRAAIETRIKAGNASCKAVNYIFVKYELICKCIIII